jgi:DHA1 family tetracycline resistance protein-like MFS transporter
MAYGVGFILGPALGGVLGQWNLNAPVYAAGVIFLFSTALVYFRLPESLPAERRARSRLSLTDFNPFASVAQMMRKPGLGILLLIVALFNFSFDGVNSVTGVFIKNKFHSLPLTLGLLMVAVGISTAFVQATLIERLVKKYGEKRMAFVGLLASIIGWPLLALAPALWILFVVAFLQSGITGFIWATTGTLAANHVKEHEQGQLAGVNVALSGLMAMLGPLWAGTAYDHVDPGSPYWIGALVLLFACGLLSGVKVKRHALSDRQQNAFSTAD